MMLASLTSGVCFCTVFPWGLWGRKEGSRRSVSLRLWLSEVGDHQGLSVEKGSRWR